ncbi:Carboxysome Shell Carbonic Anhydrase [Franzmannia pantelleriensis]|uniref:Carboxysome Shell Carbonic Anhydrase n=1 Tax=Franzmannia pantelleriensis TaxID=48727 RepID=A0A1G9M3L0_9GAMM|nr:carboxysome shell carbonic anhydrase domain-containg protein [Halomonas pantelleriensis]SDL68860.1 Carboxysome Shell Carbonic Anhydrase [Halomonas pantelleriensis]
MEIHDRPLTQRIEWLLTLSRDHAETFGSPSAWLARERYLAAHPTRIVAMKCMDGRIHLPHATRTPLGIIRPFRNLGGIFHLGWPYLGEMLAESVSEAARAGHGVLMLITYHFSRGERSRGCAGFDCDTQAALAHAYQIRAQAEQLFGADHRHVYPLVCGFETDNDALIVHGDDGSVLDISTLDAHQANGLTQRITALCPDMPAATLRDLLPLLEGNLAHVESLRGVSRALDIEHREWVICVGRGFDFLHVPNTALIVGPYSPNLSEPVGTAASIIDANMRAGRIPDDGFMLLASTPYQDIGVDRARAELKARFLSDFASQVISREHPALAERMVRHTAVVHWPTRRLDLLDTHAASS